MEIIANFYHFNWINQMQEATAMNPDMTVEKIEIQQQTQ